MEAATRRAAAQQQAHALLPGRLRACSGAGRAGKRARDVARAAEPRAEPEVRRLKRAAKEYAEALQLGMDEDEVVALQLGATDVSQLTETQQLYLDKIKAKLAREAEEERRRQQANSLQFSRGKAAYSTGEYAASVSCLEAALQQEGSFSPLGGEIQLWLALAYQACGREAECIELYKSIEQNHPLPKVKRQAAELRFIAEAPRLKIGPDERVKLPILEDQSRYVRQRGPQPRPPARAAGRKVPKSFEEEFWENYRPPVPELVKNRYFLVASGVLATGLAWYSAVLSRALVR